MKYGLIGEKLGHSFSVEIHGKLADYPYELKEIAQGDLDAFFKAKDFTAINVTIPYKEKVIPYMRQISPIARAIGAVNTVVNQNGHLYGFNTDYHGAIAMILQAGIDVKGKKALILGTGGTAKTLSVVLSDMGVGEALFVSRTQSSTAISYEDALTHHQDARIIVNTTPVGMFPHNENTPIDLSAFPCLEGVIDVIYNPLSTTLVQKAKSRGIKATGGLYMLAAQGAYASALFLGEKLDEAKEQKVYQEVLRDKQNIVLIGMPSSGKSTIGKSVAKALKRPFFDSDKLIVERAGKSIPEIFEDEGEGYFRKLEQEVIGELSKKSGVVIATGGGVILRQENIDALKQNGVLFFLDRSIELLTPTKSRPLSRNREALKQRYTERLPLYRSAADVILAANGSVKAVTNQLIKEFTK